MKKIVKGKECTILCHVDNVKMLNVDYETVSSVIDDIDTEHGKIPKMTITRGKINKYLRMAIGYSFPGKLKLSMVDYIGNMLDDIP